ncbi:hypothetical protein EDC96DRAFT_565311 [Choanephora cucurbitarum]|nr:hypothetical protein EDC96DRAFT_565311 [Choanephora cucurbitarum]
MLNPSLSILTDSNEVDYQTSQRPAESTKLMVHLTACTRLMRRRCKESSEMRICRKPSLSKLKTVLELLVLKSACQEIDLLLRIKDSKSNEWKSSKTKHMFIQQSKNILSNCSILSAVHVKSKGNIDKLALTDFMGTTGYMHYLSLKDDTCVRNTIPTLILPTYIAHFQENSENMILVERFPENFEHAIDICFLHQIHRNCCTISVCCDLDSSLTDDTAAIRRCLK